jgi:hypothetical protein
MKILLGFVVALSLLFVGYYAHMRFVGNPQVIAELQGAQGGTRADRVMLITLPDGQELPVNYLREGSTVFVGVDGLWWRQFREAPQTVKLTIRGDRLAGQALAILDDPAYTEAVFARLRPTAPTWLPGRLRGVLLEITLNPGTEG